MLLSAREKTILMDILMQLLFAKLEDDDVQIYRTDTMGTIEAVSDGNQIHMETEKGKTNE